jgi:hypothetical protein
MNTDIIRLVATKQLNKLVAEELKITDEPVGVSQLINELFKNDKVHDGRQDSDNSKCE